MPTLTAAASDSPSSSDRATGQASAAKDFTAANKAGCTYKAQDAGIQCIYYAESCVCLHY